MVQTAFVGASADLTEGVAMFAGDEFYDDDITSGPIEDDYEDGDDE